MRILCFSICLLYALTAMAEDRPQWGERHSRNMVSAEKGLPASLDPSTGRNIQWSAELGTTTYSTPVIGSGRILVGTNNGRPRDPRHRGDSGILMCFSEADGAFLWQLVVPKISDIPLADSAGTGLCSPATIEGDRAYVVTNRNEVLCLDMDGQVDGNDGPFVDEGALMVPKGKSPMTVESLDADVLWRFDMAEEIGAVQHDGVHASPLLFRDCLYLCTSNGVDHTHKQIPAPDAPSLIALDKNTGKLVAVDGLNMGRQMIHSTWSSPSAGQVGGKGLIFFGGPDCVCYGFEPAEMTSSDPKPLVMVWRFHCDPAGRREDPMAFQDNREEGPSLIIGMPVFCEGRIYVTVGGDVWHGRRVSWLKSIDASKVGDITSSGEIWSFPLTSHCMTTPAIHEGLAYVTDSGGMLHCVDAQTGQEMWTHDAGGEFWASPLVADSKVYVGTLKGQLLVFEAGRSKKILATVDLGSPVAATPVAANGVLYITTIRALYACREDSPSSR